MLPLRLKVADKPVSPDHFTRPEVVFYNLDSPPGGPNPRVLVQTRFALPPVHKPIPLALFSLIITNEQCKPARGHCGSLPGGAEGEGAVDVPFNSSALAGGADTIIFYVSLDCTWPCGDIRDKISGLRRVSRS